MPWLSNSFVTTGVAAGEKAAGLCSHTKAEHEDNAEAAGILCTENKSIIESGQEAEKAPLETPDDGAALLAPQDLHEDVTVGINLNEKVGGEGTLEDLGDEQSAPGSQGYAPATTNGHPAGAVQQSSSACTLLCHSSPCLKLQPLSKVLASPVNGLTKVCSAHAARVGAHPARPDELHPHAGDDHRLTKALHQGLNHTEASMSQIALIEGAAMLLRSNRHSSVTETPRGIVARSVVDRIIADL